MLCSEVGREAALVMMCWLVVLLVPRGKLIRQILLAHKLLEAQLFNVHSWVIGVCGECGELWSLVVIASIVVHVGGSLVQVWVVIHIRVLRVVAMHILWMIRGVEILWCGGVGSGCGGEVQVLQRVLGVAVGLRLSGVDQEGGVVVSEGGLEQQC